MLKEHNYFVLNVPLQKHVIDSSRTYVLNINGLDYTNAEIERVWLQIHTLSTLHRIAQA